jgi:hypothetical protein
MSRETRDALTASMKDISLLPTGCYLFGDKRQTLEKIQK